MKYVISFVCFAFAIEIVGAALRPRIIGGADADIKDFPYQASIRLRYSHACGGTIISDRHILTAAHCFPVNRKLRVNPPIDEISVYTGTSYSFKETGFTHQIAKITLHPLWTGKPNSSNDIAIVTLAEPIGFDDTQKKIDLATQDIVSGVRAVMTGWGATTLSRKPKIAMQLQKIEMTLLTKKDCQPQLPITLKEDEMCAHHRQGYGFCKGDSGGPLVVDNQVVGIISWVYDDECASGIPEVFTNVYRHKKFIESTMNE